jgi:modulator of FtsH protease HflC
MADNETKKKRHWPAIVIVASCALIFLISSMTYTVANSEHVMVTRFGSFKKLAEPGLNFKLLYPIDDVVRIDKRLQHFERPLKQTAIKGLRNFFVAITAGWKVKDAQKFHKSLGTIQEATVRMEQIIGTPASSIFSEYSIEQIFTTKEKDHKVDEIRAKILKEAKALGDKYGIEVTYVGFSQLAMPPDATGSGLERMRSERQVQAEIERNKGEKNAQEIISKANQEAQTLISKAQIAAETIKRQGDEDAVLIYKEFKHPELVAFLRQLETLEKTLSTSTKLVIDMNTPPFNLLRGEFYEKLMKEAKNKFEK